MRTLLLLGLLFANIHLFAQVTPDSLLPPTKIGQQEPVRKDSLDVRIRQAHRRLDSLRQVPRSRVDSLRAMQYGQHQRDSLHQQVQRWKAQRDSLLRPSDTLQHKINQTQQRVRSWQDSMTQKIPAPASEAIRSATSEALPDEVTDVLSYSQQLPNFNLPRMTYQLPNLPPPVHAVREHATVWQEKLSTYPATLSGYQGKTSPYTSALNQGSEALDQQVLQHAPESELLQTGGSSEGLFDFSDRAGFAQQQQRAQLQQRMIASAKDHFAEHGEVLQDAQQQLGKLKKKYSEVNGDTRQKRSSLQGTPLGKRLVYGGTMQLQRTPSLSIDLAPQLAYQFNKRISSGVGLVYRLAPEGGLKQLRQQLTSNNAVYGGRLYGEYEVVRSLLLHGEYERLSQRVATTGENLTDRQWQSSLLAGVGKTYQIAGKWQGSVLVLYNFRHQQQTIHSRPWVVRFGFQRVSSK